MARSGPGDPYESPLGVPSSIGDVIRGLLAERTLRRGVALGRLATRWGDVVGEQLGRVSAPRALDDGVLVVAVESPAWAAQVSFLGEEIRRSANEALGSEEVRTVRVVVGSRLRKPLRRNG